MNTDWHCDGQEHKGYLDLNVLRESCYSESSRAKRKEDTRPLVAVSSSQFASVRNITIDFICYMHRPHYQSYATVKWYRVMKECGSRYK